MADGIPHTRLRLNSVEVELVGPYASGDGWLSVAKDYPEPDTNGEASSMFTRAEAEALAAALLKHAGPST